MQLCAWSFFVISSTLVSATLHNTICMHSFVICCTVHGVPHQVTLEAIPLDVLCEIWEAFDHVEHFTCERVSDPQQVCLVLFLTYNCLCVCST